MLCQAGKSGVEASLSSLNLAFCIPIGLRDDLPVHRVDCKARLTVHFSRSKAVLASLAEGESGAALIAEVSDCLASASLPDFS